jgi:hypothetical protein
MRNNRHGFQPSSAKKIFKSKKATFEHVAVNGGRVGAPSRWVIAHAPRK